MASIKKINSRKYKITVSNGYRANGKKISRAKTIHVPESVHPRSIAQYVAHGAEDFERLVKNGFGEDADTPFEDFARSWLKRQANYAPTTLAMYKRMLEVTFRYIGAIPLSKLRPIALENMLIELRKRTHHGKPVREATVQKYLTAVSAVLSDAKRNEIIQKNPAHMIDLPDAKPREQFVPDPDEAARFLRSLMEEPPHYKVFYLLAICTGCRRGELCALKWSDFPFESVAELSMVVSRSRSSVAGVGVVEGTTKNGRTRVIALGEDMSLVMSAYFCYKNREAERNHYPFGEYVFTDEHGRLIHPDTFTKHLRKFYDRHGFSREYHLHTLRHLYVTTLLHGGVDKQTVADLAGHGDTSFLERTYCHPQMERKREAARVISGIIPGSVEDKSA